MLKKVINKAILIMSDINQKRRLIVRDLKYSNSFRSDRITELSSLLVDGHVLEKGITMPNRRDGFGYERVRRIIEKCCNCINRYGRDATEIQAAIFDLEQYYCIHQQKDFKLPQDIVNGIKSLMANSVNKDENCYYTTKEDYFKKTDSYAEFVLQRHSVRNFSKQEIDNEIIIKAIELAQSAPSACNRQSVRVKIIENRNVIDIICTEIQNGNRGFGHLANKWLLVTSEMGAWSHDQMSMAYIDGGIFTMSLLNALHYYGICACTLNAHLSSNKQRKLCSLLGCSVSELPIVFIAIGRPTDTFMIAKSRRKNVQELVTII